MRQTMSILKSHNSLTEEEVLEKYEKISHFPVEETMASDVEAHDIKLQTQSRDILGLHSDGLRVRKKTGVGSLEHYDSDEEDNSDSDDRTVDIKYGDKEDFQRPSKLDLIVGFLRLFNFLSCATAVFGVTFSILYSLSSPSSDLVISTNLTTVYNIWSPLTLSPDEQYSRNYREDSEFLFGLKIFSSLVLLVYLFTTSILVLLDSVATVTFRWREYGELTHRHTDATSVLFLVSKSRWKLRLLTSLSLTSAVSLQTTQIIINHYGRSLEDLRSSVSGLVLPGEAPHAIHAVTWYIALLSLSMISFIIGILLSLIPAPWRDCPWLDNTITDFHVDDKGDIWRSSTDIWLQLSHVNGLVSLSSTPQTNISQTALLGRTNLKTYQRFTFLGHVLEGLKKIVYFVSYVTAITMNLRAVILMELDIRSFEFWTCIISISSTTMISLYLVMLVCIQCFKVPPSQTPFLSKVYVPFTLSSGLRLILDLRRDVSGQDLLAYSYVILMSSFVVLELLSLATKNVRLTQPIRSWAAKFLTLNFYSCGGAYKKCVRLFDTVGSCFGLISLLLGLFSVLCDQYDLEFQFEGDLKSFIDGVQTFNSGIRSVADALKRIIDPLDLKITCEAVYTTIASGTVAAGVLGLLPGASSVANFGSKGAYYTVKTGNALTRMAQTLADSAKKIWKVANVIGKIGSFSVRNFRTFTIGGSTMTLLRLLPFIPPVVLGIHLLFAAFWPKRVLFFHGSQRRSFVNGMFWKWIGILILLLLALLINTLLVDEVAAAFNEAVPVLNVHVRKKLGWRLSIAASTFALISTVSFIISYGILKFKTEKNHENLTNEEKEWNCFVDSKKKCTYYNAFGPKIEWKNQIKYKKERIGGCNWLLPIVFCSIACSLGIVANLYPKIDMYREPKGAFGRTLDKILTQFMVYEDDMRRVREYGERDCLPFATFQDVLSENMDERANILMNPIYHFFNKTEELMKPLKQIVSRTRDQFIADIGNELFGEEAIEQIQNLRQFDFQYLGMILLIPRLLNLLTLIFGALTMSVATCQMEIIPAIEPRKIVNFYGSVCIFSIIYVLGTQMALFNILSDIGVPFYKITVRLGLGFMYDVAADAIMLSVYIGMKNEFFFTIPRRKVTVSYSVPGVSDSGPNPQNRIL